MSDEKKVPFTITPDTDGAVARKKKKTIHVNIYARTSTGEQSTGRDTQIAVCEKGIEAATAEDGVARILNAVVVDENVYGDLDPEKRPHFPEILQHIADGKGQELWMHSRDRLSRDVDLLGYARIILRKQGCDVRCLDDTEDKALGRVKDLFGENELDKYREKRKQGVKRAVDAGKVMTRPPFGYAVERDSAGKSTGLLIIDEEQRATVFGIMRLLDKDEMSLRRIGMEYGVHVSVVRNIRDNPIYRTGEVFYRGKVINTVEPILKETEDDDAEDTPEE